MSRAALILAFLATNPALAVGPWGGHVDRSAIPGGCLACHRGHGISNSPMLPLPQKEVCLSCHGGETAAREATQRGWLNPTAKPTDLSRALLQPYQHPVDPLATSSQQGVTCTSCHSPHRATPPSQQGGKKLSPKDPRRLEHELCESCHGSLGVATQSLSDLSRRFDPSSRSFHPVHAPSPNRSPSVVPALAGKEIGCSDCHGNDDPTGPRGPHGSSTRFLLKAAYVTTDGQADDEHSYALCYGCHQRHRVLAPDSPFPFHRKHVVEAKASCATCHSAHGSPANRALIRFGEETFLAGVSPSASGRLQFLSTLPGSGTCFLTCHGKNHDPATYGSAPLAAPGTLAPGEIFPMVPSTPRKIPH